MTGRFSYTHESWDVLEKYFGVSQAPLDIHPRYNIAPQQLVPVVYAHGKENAVGLFKWGLVPYWAADPKIGNQTINARAETLREKPSFKHLIGRKHCLVPACGVYEWKKAPTGKQPMRVVVKDRPVFAMAGLYDRWLAPTGQVVDSFTIITTEPNELMKPIHNRMPVIIDPLRYQEWLYPSAEIPKVMQLLVPYPSDRMAAYPVSTLVNSVYNDVPECIEPIQFPS